MSDTPLLFDRSLHRRRRERAAAQFAEFDFLKARAAAEIEERLWDIQRQFEVALDFGSHTGLIEPERLPPGKIGTLIRSDLSKRMLDGAISGLAVVADEEVVPFGAETLDLVVSGLSLHWVNDLPGTLIQLRRALKPDGLLIGAIFGRETLIELREALSEAELECDGGVSARVSPFGDQAELAGLLQRAGFALPVVDSDLVTVTYQHPFKLLGDLRGMGETNALLGRRRVPMKRGTLMRAMEIYQSRFGLADGRVPASFEIVYLTGWAPHESQQKPLRPGSAAQRLADALGSQEVSTGVKPGDD